MAELLLAAGADASAENKGGETPLQLSELEGANAVTDLLRMHGAQRTPGPGSSLK